MTETPERNQRFEMAPARYRPNDPDMTTMAAGKNANSCRTQEKALRPEANCGFIEPAVYASVAVMVRCRKRSALSAVLAAVCARPHPPTPASARAVARACENHRMLRTPKPRITVAM